MTRCDPPQDGSDVLIDHHTGLKLVMQPRKEPPRALRHPRLVAATTHNYEHPSHHLLPVTLDDDDGVIEIDDAVRVAGWQGDVVLGSVT